MKNQPVQIALLSILFAVTVASCTPNPTSPPTQQTGSHVGYVLTPTALPPLRTGEHYIFWIRLYGSTTYLKVTELRSSAITTTGTLPSATTPDTVDEARITIEADADPSMPGSSLIGGVRGSTDSIFLGANTGYGVADLSNVTGAITFATMSSDTTRAQQEFYLMQLQKGVATQSLQNLPNLSIGWHYATWVVDSSFYPAHLFYYGAFLHSSGHDSDSLNDTYPFPGGYEPPSLGSSNGMIKITVEPDFLLSKLRQSGPSSFPFLVCQIPRHIYLGEQVPLVNATNSTIPSATLALTQQ